MAYKARRKERVLKARQDAASCSAQASFNYSAPSRTCILQSCPLTAAHSTILGCNSKPRNIVNRTICGVDLLVCLLFLLAFSSDLMLCHCRIGGDSTWGCFTPKLDTHSSSAPRPTVHFCTTLRSCYTARVCIGESRSCPR